MKSKPTKPSDEKIISLFWERNEDAIGETDRIYGKYLFTTAFNILGDEGDSRECVNDTLFHLWTHIPPDRPKWFKGYAARIAHNLALHRLEEQGRQKRVPSQAVIALDDLIDYLDDGSSVEKQIDDNLLRACLDRFLDSLDKRQRMIFVGRYYSCFTTAQLARLLDLSERQVYRELTKMKTHLKEILHKEGFTDV